MSKKIIKNRVRTYRTFLEPVKVQTNRDKKSETVVSYARASYPVWCTRASLHPECEGPKSTMDFEWPRYNNSKDHIKGFTELAKGMTITEAFEAGYGIKVNVDSKIKTQVDDVPAEMKVGDVVKLNISHCDKNGVEFDCLNRKQQIVSCINLHKYERFKHSTPTEPVKVKVVSVSHNKVIVDPLTPALDDWLTPILNNPTKQRVIDGVCPITVRRLKLTKGGFVGRAVIPSISEFIGEPYTIEAFIPGSQIVLNIENDFSRWEGADVQAFVTAYIPKPGNLGQMSLICSVKEYLKFLGERNMMSLFGKWCDDGKEWETLSREVLPGRVTGIINSSKKCGVFVEVPALNITGMVNVKAEELVNYKPGDRVVVRLANFEENTYYDDATKQIRHDEPYHIENGVLTKCNLKPVLEFVSVTEARPEP